ncbi:hypothetical protein BASA81_006014 [Batrachochytrium salamandrivorans]|nr:hypothetical protein BASA81_006014 [Batrachochytrium salamandrivorans]
MEKLVADLSARIKSLEKESIIPPERSSGVTGHSQPCHTGMCHFCQSTSNSARTQKSFFLTNSTDLAVTFEVSSISSNYLSDYNHSPTAPSNLRLQQSELYYPEERLSAIQDSTIAFRNVAGNRRSLLDPCPSDHPTTFHVLEGHLINPENPTINKQQQQQHQLQHQHQLRPEYQTNSSTPPAARQPDYMDVDLVRRGPLSSAERQHRMSQRLCLVCGQAGHIKATCPKSNSKFGTSKSVRAIQTSDNDDETSGNDQGCY